MVIAQRSRTRRPRGRNGARPGCRTTAGESSRSSPSLALADALRTPAGDSSLARPLLELVLREAAGGSSPVALEECIWLVSMGGATPRACFLAVASIRLLSCSPAVRNSAAALASASSSPSAGAGGAAVDAVARAGSGR